MATHNIRDGEDIVRLDLPSNSHKAKDAAKPKITKPPMKKVASNITVRKPGIGSKILTLFGGATLAVVSEYVVNDILIPEAKNILSEIIRGGSDMMLFGEQQAGSRSRLRSNQNSTFISYNRGSQSNRKPADNNRNLGRTIHNFNDIIFNTSGDAEEALNMLKDRIAEYGETTVADLYELAGVTGSFADNKYGWTDLNLARIQRDRSGGYIILFPKTVPLV